MTRLEDGLLLRMYLNGGPVLAGSGRCDSTAIDALNPRPIAGIRGENLHVLINDR
jgi:hypothetical protein